MRGRALEARHERARQQENARQGIVAQLAEQRTIEAQARHREKMEAAAAARERKEKEYEQAQITAWRKAQELQEVARRRLEEEQRAAAEAEKVAWEASRHQREVAALLERSSELRELKQKLQAAEEEFEKERAAVDAVVARIEEEERAAEEVRARQRQMAQADIARFLAQRQELRQRQREADAAEERSVQEYLRKRREREAAEAARQANKCEAQDRAYEVLKRQKEEEDACREEEDALLDFVYRPSLCSWRQREPGALLLLQAERLAVEKAREDDFRRRMLDRLEEEDRLEQMNAQKRRAKQAAHMREVERLLAFRRQLYQAMREAEEAEEAREAEERARQDAIVEAERQHMLRQAAAQLPRDCLPKGVFKSFEDLRLVGQPVNGGGGISQAGALAWGHQNASGRGLPAPTQWVAARPQAAGGQQDVPDGWQNGPTQAPNSNGWDDSAAVRAQW